MAYFNLAPQSTVNVGSVLKHGHGELPEVQLDGLPQCALASDLGYIHDGAVW